MEWDLLMTGSPDRGARPASTSWIRTTALVTVALLGSPLRAQSLTERVSIDPAGGEANDRSQTPSISADGRLVAFWSAASNLVPGDTNGVGDIFVHDRRTGETTRVSVSSMGGEANGTSSSCAISADGRYVAFASRASNLVSGDTNGVADVFLHDRWTHATRRASLDSAGNQGDGTSLECSVAEGGRYVVFTSDATNLVPGDGNGTGDVFLHNLATGTTTRVSVDSNGIEGNGRSRRGVVSADGRYVAFESEASNLVTGDTNDASDVFVHDLATGVTTRASVDSTGVQGDRGSQRASISRDGALVAFDSDADNLVPADTNAHTDVFVRDRTTGTTTRASVSSSGEQADRASHDAALSPDGRRIAFDSGATNLVLFDSNGEQDVFVHDLTSGETICASLTAAGDQARGPSQTPSLAATAAVAFVSDADNLVGNDENQVRDVFVHMANPIRPNDEPDATMWTAMNGGPIDSGWFSEHTPDDVDATFEVIPGIGNPGDRLLAGGLPIRGIAVSVGDFGSSFTFPRVGVYRSNLVVDPAGQTPDLSAPIVEIPYPPVLQVPLFQFVTLPTPDTAIPAGDTRVHSVAQWPAGDSGLLSVGLDSSAGASGGSGFTTDGYVTPSISMSFADWGLNIGQDNVGTKSCRPSDRQPFGRLRVSRLLQGIGEGDRLTIAVNAGDVLDLAFFGARTGDQLRLFGSTSPCTPAIAIGPVLNAIPDHRHGTSFLRVNATWPLGFGGQTFSLSAAWGNPACASPAAGFTNCVTIITSPDPVFGICDDGTIESGWVVQIPSGPSDYFNDDFGAAPSSVSFVTGLSLAVLDFGTATPAFPQSGVSLANLSVDPTGKTPDIANPLARIAPFTFPAGTFATTSLQYVAHACAVPASALAGDVHGWVQLPPGDPGLLGIGADSSSPSNGCSFFTLDGYQSPAVGVSVNWGIRISTN